MTFQTVWIKLSNPNALQIEPKPIQKLKTKTESQNTHLYFQPTKGRPL